MINPRMQRLRWRQPASRSVKERSLPRQPPVNPNIKRHRPHRQSPACPTVRQRSPYRQSPASLSPRLQHQRWRSTPNPSQNQGGAHHNHKIGPRVTNLPRRRQDLRTLMAHRRRPSQLLTRPALRCRPNNFNSWSVSSRSIAAKAVASSLRRLKKRPAAWPRSCLASPTRCATPLGRICRPSGSGVPLQFRRNSSIL